MLGHALLTAWRDRHNVRVTLRNPLGHYTRLGLFNSENAYAGVDVRDEDALSSALTAFNPETVINCAGIIKQRQAAQDPITSIEINSLFPHRLSVLCEGTAARLVHISTDCVFSGHGHMYRENDPPDPTDLYGRSKLLGEIIGPGGITLRSSIIGLELKNRHGLIEWFLTQSGQVNGFQKVIYTGITTQEMARVIEMVSTSHRNLDGLWHVASDPISKYDLLCMLVTKLGRTDVTIIPDDTVVCDRSLSGRKFERMTGYKPPSWDVMLDELAAAIKLRHTKEEPIA